MGYFFYYLLSLFIASLVDVAWHTLFFTKSYTDILIGLNNPTEFTTHILPLLLSQGLMITTIYMILYIARPRTPHKAILIGAIAGTLAVTIYALTNYAILEHWTFTATALEVAWGPLFGAFLGYMMYYFQLRAAKLS